MNKPLVGSFAPDAFPWEMLLGFAVAFVVFWLLIAALLGIASGWPGLARRFRATARPAGVALTGQVWRFGSIPERNVTGMIQTPDGLYLWTLWPFRLLRPPLLIPWADVEYVRERKRIGSTTHALSLGGVEVGVTQKAYDAIRPFMR